MAAIERTAYPRFRAGLTTEEIAELYTPTDEEVAFVKKLTRQPPQQLALLIALKCVHRLCYFPLLPDVPMAIQTFLCDALHLPRSTLPITEVERTRYRHRDTVRSFLGLNPYTHHADSFPPD